MVYKGIVKGNTIIINQPGSLTDGTEVEIIPLDKKETKDPICGSWKDNRTADEIIKEIRSSHYSRNKNIDL